MSYLVYINQQLIDVPVDMVLALTINGVDPSDITSRSSNPTNELVFDRTPRNERIMSGASSVNSSGSVVYNKIRADIIDKGIPIVLNGVGQVEEFDARYKMTVYAGVADVFSSISDKKLETLTFDESFIVADFDYRTDDDNEKKATDTVVFFPDIDFGNGDDYNLPSFCYDKLIEKIFSDAGYNVFGGFKTDTLYKKLIMPYSRDTLSYGADFITNRAFKAIRTTDLAGYTGNGQYAIPFNSTIKPPGIPDYFGTTTFDTNASALSTDLKDTRFFKGSIEFFIPFVFSAGTGNNYKVRVIGTTPAGSVVVWDSGAIYAPNTNGFISQKVDAVITAFHIIIERTISGTSSFVVKAGAYVKLVPENSVQEDEVLKFKIKEFLPDYKQVDLIKDFIVRFALIMKAQGKDLYFKSIASIIADKSSAIDWTSKVDVTDKPAIKFKPDGWFKNNYFKYSGNDEFDPSLLGFGNVVIDNALLSEKQDYYKSDFEGSIESAPVGAHHFNRAFIPCWVSPPSGYTVPFDNAPGFRLLYDFRQAGTASNYPDTGTFTYNDFNAGVDAMSFQYLLTAYYGGFISALHKFKLVTKFYKLSAEDVVKYDPFKLVYDSGSYYMLVEAPSYEIGTTQSTKVTLLKVS